MAKSQFSIARKDEEMLAIPPCSPFVVEDMSLPYSHYTEESTDLFHINQLFADH